MPKTYQSSPLMSLGDHLDELRRRLVLAIAAPLPLMVILFIWSNPLLVVILKPVYDAFEAAGLPPRLQVLSPPEMVLVKMKVSAIFALVLSAPWVLYHLWMFVAPGLYKHERRFVHLLIPGSTILTISGVLLLQLVMLPMMLQVLMLFAVRFEVPTGPRLDADIAAIVGTAEAIPVRAVPPADPEDGQIWLLAPEMTLQVAQAAGEGEDAPVEIVDVPARNVPSIEQPFRLREVVNFTLMMLAAIVIAFQLPLVMVLVGWIGAVDPKWLGKQRRYALFACSVAAAVLTPQDIASMLMMLVPLYGLFELGLILMRLLPASRVVRAPEDDDDDPPDTGVDPGGGGADPSPAGPPEPMPAPDTGKDGDLDDDQDLDGAGAPEAAIDGERGRDRGTWPRPADDIVPRTDGFTIDPAAEDLDEDRGPDGKDAP